MFINKFMDQVLAASNFDSRRGAIFIHKSSRPKDFDKVELKGQGHPDTLADALATHLSREYSLYTLEHFGIILHHNFDKIGLMGGRAEVAFGKGKILSPIRVLLNGRASDFFGETEIPLRELLIGWTKVFFTHSLPLLDVEKDIKIMYEVSSGSSPGQVCSKGSDDKRLHWFKPRNVNDIGYLKRLVANDTSTGAAFYPLSLTDVIVRTIEKKLNSKEYKADKPWLGNDIKITATRHNKLLSLTACIPQIAQYVLSLESYRDNLSKVREDIESIVVSVDGSLQVDLELNTRDKYDSLELYLTVTGSSIEMGDEGFVGRGNRGNGLIDMHRAYSMEGASGKNPVYHVGFIYTACAERIAKRLFEITDSPIEVFLTSQSGRSLTDPKDVTVIIEADCLFDEELIKCKIKEELDAIPLITKCFLEGHINLY